MDLYNTEFWKDYLPDEKLDKYDLEDDFIDDSDCEFNVNESNCTYQTETETESESDIDNESETE